MAKAMTPSSVAIWVSIGATSRAVLGYPWPTTTIPFGGVAGSAKKPAADVPPTVIVSGWYAWLLLEHDEAALACALPATMEKLMSSPARKDLRISLNACLLRRAPLRKERLALRSIRSRSAQCSE